MTGGGGGRGGEKLTGWGWKGGVEGGDIRAFRAVRTEDGVQAF